MCRADVGSTLVVLSPCRCASMSNRRWTRWQTTRPTPLRAGFQWTSSAWASPLTWRADGMRTRIAMHDPTSSPASLPQATERQCMPELTAVPTDTSDVILSAEGLVKHFPIKEGIFFKHEVGSVKAVDGVSLTVRRGETLGLVGETGCGKSTLARCIMRLYPLTAGRLVFDGADISTLSRSRMRPVRRGMQMIFQDPYGSLNPRRRVG